MGDSEESRQGTSTSWNVVYGAGLVLGLLFTTMGIASLASKLGNRVPVEAALTATLVGIAVTVFCARGLHRSRLRAKRIRDDALVVTGAAGRSGHSVTVRVADDHLVLEHYELRTWVAVVGGIAMAGHVVAAIGGVFAGAATTVPIYVWALPFAPFLNRQVRRSIPLDALSALEVLDRTIRLHRRGGGHPPLDLAVKSWTVQKLVAALRARHPDGFAAEPPATTPEPRDELAEARAAIQSWMPDTHAAATTMVGLLLVAGSLLLGGFVELGLGGSIERWIAIALWGGACLVWLLSSNTRRMQLEEAARLADGPVEPPACQVRRQPGDLIGLVFPWTPAALDAREDRLVLTRRPRDMFEVVALTGVAVAGGWLVFGSMSPLAALGFGLPLLFSGYPRPREDEELFLPEHVIGFRDAGGRGWLSVRDEDGDRTLQLRYEAKHGRRLVALFREACPDAKVEEPGWRTSSRETPPPDASPTGESSEKPAAAASDPEEALRRLTALRDEVSRDG